MALDVDLPENIAERAAGFPQKTKKQLKADIAKLEVERSRHDNNASNLMISALLIGVVGMAAGLLASAFWLFLLIPAAVLTAAAVTGPIPKWSDTGDKIAKVEKQITDGDYAPEVKAPANTNKPKTPRKSAALTQRAIKEQFTAMSERIKALEALVEELQGGKIDKAQPRKMREL